MSGFWVKGFEGIGCAWVQEVEVDWKLGMSLQGGDSEHWPKLLMLQCPLLYFFLFLLTLATLLPTLLIFFSIFIDIFS